MKRSRKISAATEVYVALVNRKIVSKEFLVERVWK